MRGCLITGAIGIFTLTFSGGGFPDLVVSVSWVRFPVRERGRVWRAHVLSQSN
nr:MAG TPA: hypothetical protein [Bacteriophage sp.]